MQVVSDEISRLKKGRAISHSSSIKSLNPVIDEEDTLRVGGRIKHAPSGVEAKY